MQGASFSAPVRNGTKVPHRTTGQQETYSEYSMWYTVGESEFDSEQGRKYFRFYFRHIFQNVSEGQPRLYPVDATNLYTGARLKRPEHETDYSRPSIKNMLSYVPHPPHTPLHCGV
jgi:hypothetical protein